MCGIVGSTENKVFRNDLHLISKRGPDQKGLYHDKDISLGHTRLSIVDPKGDFSSQPAVSSSGILVYNGEIYNFPSLARELSISTNSDTDFLLKCIEKIGVEKTISKINGMFAFCYYDKKKKKVWLVRDRLGQKPLFYSHNKKGLIFSSSIELVKKVSSEENFEIDESILGFYFSAFYIPAPYTIYKQVKSVSPGHYLVYDIPSGSLKEDSYWSIPRYKKETEIEDFDSLFRDATLTRMMSDVPLGNFLSGGVDSSLVVQTMAESGIEKIQTYTAEIQDSLNESEYADKVSRKFNTDHRSIKVDKSSFSSNLIKRLIKSFGQPFADSSIIPTYKVCQLISNHVTVAISGDGADELFMGYDKYRKNKSFENTVFRNTDLSFLKKNFRVSPIDIVKKIIPDFEDMSHIEKIRAFDARIFLEGDILQKVDRLSMENSLEVRSPFLDHRVCEFAMQLSEHELISEDHGKVFLKKMLAKNFEEDFIYRDKIGFMLSIEEWREEILRTLTRVSKVSKGASVLKNDVDYNKIRTYTLFAILVFLVWYEEEHSA